MATRASWGGGRQTFSMRFSSQDPERRPSRPSRPDAEGWLLNRDQGLAVRFRSAPPSAHGQWVYLETAAVSEARRRPAVLQHRRRMLRHNALDAWTTMLNTGWERCGPQW